MTSAGWIFVSLFWGLVIALNIFCYVKLLKNKDHHGRE